MNRFLESILSVNQKYPLLAYHQRRIDQVFSSYFSSYEPLQLALILPEIGGLEKHKVRVVYDSDSYEITQEKYHPRSIKSIKIVRSESIEYTHKYEDRKALDNLFYSRGSADDILIIKDGMVTDSYYANPAFWDGSEWLVPKSHLLNGVKRQYLLANNKVREIVIREEDIASFEKVSLINAMLDLDETNLKIENILF